MGSVSIWHWIVVLLIIGFPIVAIVGGFQKKVLIKHSHTGLMKYGYVGWSWTYYLFGWFVPITRGEIGIGALHLIISLLTLGIFQVVTSFLYNKQYMTRMLLAGWELADSEERNNLARVKLNISSNQTF